jgi:predicted nuclease of restriction endonuclease-like (RecB) superfamily
MLKQNLEEINNTKLLTSIKELIENSKNNLAISVNAEMTMLYWSIGKQINEEIDIRNRTDSYGKKIVATLWRKLSEEYGASFSEKNIRRMMQFASVFNDNKLITELSRQLTWSHIKMLIPMTDSLKRNFYIEMSKLDRWSVRALRERIDSMLYERTAISKKPDETIQNDLDLLKNSQKLSPDLIFKDPYFLDFLGLKNNYSEKDLESAILSELENFIVELGSDFGFLARQKRITIDNEDYYIDLLFYHRRLRCLVVIELKLGKFSAADKGQVELYLRWLEKHELLEGENPPIGLILCTDKNQEHVELMQLDKSNIRVADYLTELPDKKLLESKLHQSIENAKNRLFQNIEFENN